MKNFRHAGQLERALGWVILWLKALGDKSPGHMTESVSLWVKTKMDVAKDSEDVRLRSVDNSLEYIWVKI